jgi:ABC-type uncharacterized transport system substrate-binding protein
MQRREFITLIGGSVVVWPLAAQAQRPGLPVVGFLSSRSPDEAAVHTAAFLHGMNDRGYIDGQTVAVQYRWAQGRYERLPAMAGELVDLGVNVMVAVGGSAPALAAKAAAKVPIVFLIGEDPVKVGLVSSFNRPGGNITGFSFLTGELGAKRLGLLAELVPTASTAAVLLNPNYSEADAQRLDVQSAANALGRHLLVQYASTEWEFEPVFAKLVQEGVGALVVENDPFFDTKRDRLMALAAQNNIPAIYHIREFPASGGLMSYGASLVDAYRQVGDYAGRILKGEKPDDLPVVQPTKFEFVINLKTAKSLGIIVPATLLARADEVIE